jgi:hypothetical protein
VPRVGRPVVGEAHGIGDAGQPLADLAGDRRPRPDDCDRFEQFVGDQARHLVPKAELGEAVELGVQLAEAVTVERRAVHRGGAVECELFFHGKLDPCELGFVVRGDDDRRAHDLEVASSAPACREPALERRQDILL